MESLVVFITQFFIVGLVINWFYINVVAKVDMEFAMETKAKKVILEAIGIDRIDGIDGVEEIEKLVT